MASWSEILLELKGLPSVPGVSNLDVVRRKYMGELHAKTGRNLILYATAWTAGANDEHAIITAEDIQGFMEVIHGLHGDSLDLILHSPGGSPEATEALVVYLRSKFRDIRVIVPHAAMSAATMLACAADRILMGRHSFLGPIDPQFVIRTELGISMVPAHAIIEQFEQAKHECKTDPASMTAWLPMLRQYGPALLVQCRLAQELSQKLVTAWLAAYMFHDIGPRKAKQKARRQASL